MTARSRSALKLWPFVWLGCCALFLLFIVGAGSGPLAGLEVAPARTSLDVLAGGGAKWSSAQRVGSLPLVEPGVAPASKLKRQPASKRPLLGARPALAVWRADRRAHRDSASATFRTGPRVTAIRTRIPRLGTDEPPWLA